MNTFKRSGMPEKSGQHYIKILSLLLFFFTLSVGAQTTITVTVKDAAHRAPLAFATVNTNNTNYISDIDGKVTISNAGPVFTVSYTGYTAKKMYVKDGVKYYTVSLQAKTEELNEVVIDFNDPALDIIGKAIRRKPINNPQQKLESYSYKTYESLIVTANPDSISGKLDSVFAYERAGRRFQKIDSSFFKFKRIIDRQHLYQTEKVSEFKFNKKQGLKENVLATRMAGFKKPLYEFIGLKLQSYSVYSDRVDLLQTKYAGPLSNEALYEYHFKLLDTTTVNGRQAFVVYFDARHRLKRKMRGILYIDTQTYGVAKAVLRVKNIIDVTSVHYFEYEDSLSLWFPSRKTLTITKGNNKEDLTILGETITFDGMDSHNRKRKKQPSDYMYVYSESNNFDKQFNTPVTIRRSSVEIEIKDEAVSRPAEYWNRFRPDTLDNRSLTTYMALDSLVAKDNWEQRIILGRRIINGYVPLGFFDADLRQIVKYNNYEGFRLGFGGITNNKFSEIFRISAYGAYGTKDGQFKSGGGAAVRLGRFSNTWIGGSFTDDIKEIGSTSFATDKRVFKIYDPRPINISTFYNHQTVQAYAETKIIPKTESMWQLTRSRIDPKFNYIYMPHGRPYTLFDLTVASVSIQWNPFSDFMQTPDGRIEIEKRYPKFAFQYTQAISGIWGSNFNFGKFDFRAEFEKKYLNGQIGSALIQTGVAVGETPLTHLYSTSPNNLDKDGVIQRITLAGKNSFETMYFNEFFSSRYVTVQLKHGLTKFTVFRSVKLSPMLVTRFAWGNMADKEDHLGIAFNTLEKGYFESGLEFNQIFKGLGLTGFYRYGPYHLAQFDRNISVKLSFVLDLF